MKIVGCRRELRRWSKSVRMNIGREQRFCQVCASGDRKWSLDCRNVHGAIFSGVGARSCPMDGRCFRLGTHQTRLESSGNEESFW